MDTGLLLVICTLFVLVVIFQNFRKAFEEKMQELNKKLGEKFEGKMQELDRRVGEKFESASNKAIKESLSFVQESSLKEVSKLLSPINDQLRAYEAKMDRLMRDEAIERSKMNEVLKCVSEVNRGFADEAKAFSKAMRGDIRALGKFGEDKAEMLLVASGFNEGHEFLKQKVLTTESGNIKPDFVIRLPQNRAIFVDSKMSLDSFMSYLETDDESKKGVFANDFAVRIKEHIKTLVKAGYQQCTEYQSMDYVMMFVGSDQAISLALDVQPDLQREALKKGVLLVGPTTLMCSLKTIEFLWREDRQVENLRAISELGGHLHSKLKYFLDNLKKSNECLDKSSEAMKKALNHLNRGDKSILADAKKLNELGGFSSDTLPKFEE